MFSCGEQQLCSTFPAVPSRERNPGRFVLWPPAELPLAASHPSEMSGRELSLFPDLVQLVGVHPPAEPCSFSCCLPSVQGLQGKRAVELFSPQAGLRLPSAEIPSSESYDFWGCRCLDLPRCLVATAFTSAYICEISA